jgi:hypothetical protein
VGQRLPEVSVDRERAVRLVNAAISREYNSLSTYVLHSSPYTVPEDDPALKAFEEIRDAQAASASWLTTRLRELFQAGPTLQAFEHWKRDLNYLSMPYLVKFAREHFARVAEEYEAVLKEAGDDEGLKAVFTRLRDEARAHRDRLEKVQR